jgi:tRNA pseudouridine38-40 synthase
MFLRKTEKLTEENKRRIKLTVAYDGTGYCGWQIQPNGITVQEVLNRALSELLGEEIHTIGASRTDAGVHALGNVAVFDTASRIPGEKFAFALNAGLPEDIRIQKSEEVDPAFHPRFTETIKTYEYRILNRRFPDPTRRLNSLFWYGKLDPDRMRRAAAYLVGTHDFRSFASSGGNTDETKSSIRTIYRLEIQQEEDLICLHITGNGFLYNMVRIIAGTLLEVGSGKKEPEMIPEILEAKDRARAGFTAQARGLTLVEIQYPEAGNVSGGRLPKKKILKDADSKRLENA